MLLLLLLRLLLRVLPDPAALGAAAAELAAVADGACAASASFRSVR